MYYIYIPNYGQCLGWQSHDDEEPVQNSSVVLSGIFNVVARVMAGDIVLWCQYMQPIRQDRRLALELNDIINLFPWYNVFHCWKISTKEPRTEYLLWLDGVNREKQW